MNTKRLYVVGPLSALSVLDTQINPMDTCIDIGPLDELDNWCYAEFNALGFEQPTQSALLALSAQTPLLFCWFHNEDLALDVECEGVHQQYNLSWGFKLLQQQEIAAESRLDDDWPSYGDGLKQAVVRATEKASAQAFACFTCLTDTQLASLVEMFDQDTLFNRIDEEGEDSLDIRDEFVTLLGIELYD